MDFLKEYNNLNSAQREAVDTLYGPVLVIAGPGTGKTQVLGMRVANILNRIDALPENILCITFTESGAVAMRERLQRLIGPTAHKVAVNTFHGFCLELMSRYSEFFASYVYQKPADELTSHQILTGILENLSHRSPLSVTDPNGEFVWLRGVRSLITVLKQNGLTPEHLEQILDQNDEFVAYAEPSLRELFNVPRFTGKESARAAPVIATLESYTPTSSRVENVEFLSVACLQTFKSALEQCTAKSARPLLEWRGEWLEKNQRDEWVLQATNNAQKLRSLAGIYREYQKDLGIKSLFDFDDMLLRVINALKSHDELRFNVQEQYQFLLVDEFQDTNGAQNELITILSDHPANEGQPNLLVVGDDDQAIYRFQGAESSNLLNFSSRYPGAKIVTLTDNYRSGQPILDLSKVVIEQVSTRITNYLDNIDKSLHAHNAGVVKMCLVEHMSTSSEYTTLSGRVAAAIAGGTKPSDIVVLAPQHKYLEAFAPHLASAGVPVAYERRDNVLETPQIRMLMTLARVVLHLKHNRLSEADALLPEVLSFPFLSIPAVTTWEIALLVQKSRREGAYSWLEAIRSHSLSAPIAEALLELAKLSHHETAETMLDYLIGTISVPLDGGGSYTSPLREYYFGSQPLDAAPNEYIRLLSNLTRLRDAVRAYKAGEVLRLEDVLELYDAYTASRLKLLDNSPHLEGADTVQLMTAFKSKGLEFKNVYILDAYEAVWGKIRSGARPISVPANLHFRVSGNDEDDRLRLLFVALTRARNTLEFHRPLQNDDGKATTPLAALEFANLEVVVGVTLSSEKEIITSLTASWHDHYESLALADMKSLLQPSLDKYQLSVTHLLNFLDISGGGPRKFLLQNLLQFPQSRSLSLVFGDTIHKSLEHALVTLRGTGVRKTVPEIIQDFEQLLNLEQLSVRDATKLKKRGQEALTAYLAERYDAMHAAQMSERNFKNEGAVIADVRLTGKLDRLEVIGNKVLVTDYKTGKPLPTWKGKLSEYEQIKSHNYRTQLVFYKLLVENSAFGRGKTVETGILEFIEPDRHDRIISLEYNMTPDDTASLSSLIQAVWHHIMDLNLPDVSHYEQSLKGRREFENDLRESNI